ncbi:MAG: hypothetical protein ACQEQD_01375 [Bacillota bacterium]
MAKTKEVQNKKVKVAVPGSCGELFQGKIGEDNLLISCPIDKYNGVTAFHTNKFTGVRSNKDYPKSLSAVKKFLEKSNINKIGLKLEFQSELLRSKGMGSSTADITAALSAIMILLDNKINWKILKEILISIEPTDSTPWPGLSLFDYRNGKILQPYGSPPSLDILIFSEKGKINTVQFNQNLDLLKIKNSSQESKLIESLKLIKKGIQEKNPAKLGKASIISAKLHQKIYYRSYLDNLISLIEKYTGVYGLNIAHSGTVFGILVDEKKEYSQLIAKLENEFKEINFIYRSKIVGGGIRIEEKR